MNLFSIKKGLRILGANDNNSDVLNGVDDPSLSAGVAAPEGSLYLRKNGISYKKTGAADTDWKAYSEVEGGGLLWSTISGTYTAEASKGYMLDSAGGSFTVTLPASPEEGDSVGFAGLGDISTSNITVDLNGNNMNGSGNDLIVDLDYCYFEMLYTGDATTGWVLSNTDESGNVSNIQSFIGNFDNTDAAVTEFTEENYIVGGDSLEDAIDKLDMSLFDVEVTLSGTGDDLTTLAGRVTVNEGDITSNYNSIVSNDFDIATNASGIATNASNIASNDTDISNLELFVGSEGTSSPDYSNINYVSDGDDLETAIGKLDAALKVVDNISSTGVNWRAAIKAATNSVVDTGVAAYSGTDHFADDDAPFWTHDDWVNGDQILSLNPTTSGMIYTWNDGADQWVQTDALGANDAVAVSFDFPDDPGSQEDGAAYMMNSDETAVIKIADFDLESAATIGLSGGYTAGAGVISSSDSVESAIQKLDGNIASTGSDLTDLGDRVTINEGDIITNASGIAANAADIIYNYNSLDGDITTLEGRVTVNEGNIITNASGIAANASDISDNYTYITNVDTAHDNLAAAVLHETTTVVTNGATDTVLDTVAQDGNLCAKWFVVAYDGSGNRYAAEIYAMHNGSTTADVTEYAILKIGTNLKVDFDVVANGTVMSLTADNSYGADFTIKAQRITVQTATIDTTAVLV